MASKMILSAVLMMMALAVTADQVRVMESDAPRDLLPCDELGWSCHDCNTRLLCTRLGGIRLPCWLPGPNCVDGGCSSQPSDQCAGTTSSPSHTTDSPPPEGTTDGRQY